MMTDDAISPAYAEPPFWEKRRGGGPVTEWMRARELARLAPEVFKSIDAEAHGRGFVRADGCDGFGNRRIPPKTRIR